MTISARAMAIGLAALAIPVATSAQSTPAAVTAVYQCRTIGDDRARLACFDGAAAELQKAQDARTLVFSDEDAFPPFEGTQLKSTIQQVRANMLGRWVFTLADGTRWLQTDATKLNFPPKAGDAFSIRRSVVGNFRASTRGASFQVRQIG